jgi:hypothetical protein
MDEPFEGDAPYDEEVTIWAALPGQRCTVCRKQILENDRVRVKAESGHSSIAITHVRCLEARRI